MTKPVKPKQATSSHRRALAVLCFLLPTEIMEDDMHVSGCLGMDRCSKKINEFLFIFLNKIMFFLFIMRFNTTMYVSCPFILFPFTFSLSSHQILTFCSFFLSFPS